MVDITAISAGLISLKAVAEITKSMIGLRDAEAFRSKAIELQGHVMETQSHATAAYAAQMELTNRIRDLEDEIRQARDWAKEKDRYELVDVYKRRLAYRVKEAMRGAEPQHYLCPSCLEQRKKSILQPHEWAFGESTLECTVCPFKIESGPNARA